MGKSTNFLWLVSSSQTVTVITRGFHRHSQVLVFINFWARSKTSTPEPPTPCTSTATLGARKRQRDANSTFERAAWWISWSGAPKWGPQLGDQPVSWYPEKSLDGLEWKIWPKSMIWGYPYFRKPPNVMFVYVCWFVKPITIVIVIFPKEAWYI